MKPVWNMAAFFGRIRKCGCVWLFTGLINGILMRKGFNVIDRKWKLFLNLNRKRMIFWTGNYAAAA